MFKWEVIVENVIKHSLVRQKNNKKKPLNGVQGTLRKVDIIEMNFIFVKGFMKKFVSDSPEFTH